MTYVPAPELTCQLCGRVIKLNKDGEIVHHGFKRPHHSGFQTASCRGTHHLPYEQANDALVKEIARAETFITEQTTKLTELAATPPDTIRSERYLGTGRYDYPMLPRPEDFDPKHWGDKYGIHAANSYGYWWSRRQAELGREIDSARSIKLHLEGRLAGWKQPKV